LRTSRVGGRVGCVVSTITGFAGSRVRRCLIGGYVCHSFRKCRRQWLTGWAGRPSESATIPIKREDGSAAISGNSGSAAPAVDGERAGSGYPISAWLIAIGRMVAHGASSCCVVFPAEDRFRALSGRPVERLCASGYAPEPSLIERSSECGIAQANCSVTLLR
jgi:hypothetical protein